MERFLDRGGQAVLDRAELGARRRDLIEGFVDRREAVLRLIFGGDVELLQNRACRC